MTYKQSTFSTSTTSILLMVLVVCISTIYSFDEPSIGLAHWLTFFLTWACVITISVKISPDPFSPIWILVGYLFACFFVRPLYLLFINEPGFLFSLGDIPIRANLIFQSNILLFATFATFAFGYRYMAGSIRQLASKIPTFSDTLNLTYLRLLSLFIIAIGIVSYLYVIQQLGGISEVLGKQAALVKVIPELGFNVKLAWVIFNLYFLGTILFMIANGPSKGWYIIVFIGLILFLSIGRRSPLLAMLIPLVIYRHYYVKRLKLKTAALWSSLVFLLLVGVALYRIMTADSKEALTAIAIFDSAEYFVWDMNMATLVSFGSTMEFRNGMDFLPYWFREELSLDWFATSFGSVGELSVAWFLPKFPAGIPAGLQGTLYMNWGWLGVAIGMYLLGLLARLIYEYTQQNLSSRLVTLLLYPVLLLAFFYLLRLGDFWLGFSTQIRFVLMAIFLALTSNHFRIIRLRGKNHAL